MLLRRTAGPSALPLTLAEAKAHLRVDGSAEDALVALYLDAAVTAVEAETGRALLPQDWELQLDGFPASREPVDLPIAPAMSITSVITVSAAGVQITLAGTAYQVQLPAGPWAERGRLFPPAGQDWPATDEGVSGAVRVLYRAGYASAAEVPAPLRHAALLALGDFYANREQAGATKVTDNPAFARLIAPFRLPTL